MNGIAFLKNNARWLSAGALLTFASCFGQSFFISIFADNIMSAYDLTNTQWGRVYGIGTFCSGILMLWAGGLTDRFRIRSLSMVIMLLLAAFCILMAINPFVWGLTFIIFGLRFCGQGMSFHISMVAMARWFQSTRGKAIAIAILGFSVGQAFLPVIFVYLAELVSWRTLWVVGALFAVAFIPILLALLSQERSPQSQSENSDSIGMGGMHWTRMQVMRHPLFWLVVPNILAPSTLTTALYFQQVNLIKEKGWQHIEFVALFPLYTAVSVGSMLIFGVLVDRYNATRLMPYFQIPMAIGFYLMSITASISGAALAMVFIGIMHGANSPISVAYWAEVYGVKYIGSIKSIAAGIMVFGSAIGPFISGFLIDSGMPFSDQLTVFSIITVFVCLLTLIGVKKFGPPTT